MSQGYIPGKPKAYQQPQNASYQAYQTAPAQSRANTHVTKKRSLLLLISGIIGLGYALYLVIYFAGIQRASLSGASESFDVIGQQLAGVIAVRMVTPHIIAVVLGVLLNVAAWLSNNKWIALASIVTYVIAALLFFTYALYVLPLIVLVSVSFILLDRHKIK